MSGRARVAFFLIFLQILCVAPAYGEEQSLFGVGPSGAADQYLLSALHYSHVPRSASLVEPGFGQVNVNTSWTNTNILEDDYRVDYESSEVRFRYRKRVALAWELYADLPLVWRGGGILDSPIDGWHDFFHLPQGNRDRVKDNEFAVGGSTNEGQPFELSETGLHFGNAVLGAKYQFFRDLEKAWAAALDWSLSLPSAYREYGHNGVDAGLGLVSSKRFGSWILHAGLGYIFFQDTEISGILYSRHNADGFLGLEYGFTSSLTGFVNLRAAGPGVQDISGHPEYCAYIDFELRKKLLSQAALSIGLRENLSPGDGSADISFLLSGHLGL